MNAAQAIALNLFAAVVFANLSFLRLVAIGRWHVAWSDFLGWLAGYCLWMASAAALEAALGKVAEKSWEVWAVTIALFAVLAFPGLVWRHLLRKS